MPEKTLPDILSATFETHSCGELQVYKTEKQHCQLQCIIVTVLVNDDVYRAAIMVQPL